MSVKSAALRRVPQADSGIDLKRLGELAEWYVGVDDAAALLEIGEPELRALIEDAGTRAAAVWRRGRAQARLSVRRAQFELMAKNATLAIHLGKELLGQEGAGVFGEVTYTVLSPIPQQEWTRRDEV